MVFWGYRFFSRFRWLSGWGCRHKPVPWLPVLDDLLRYLFGTTFASWLARCCVAGLSEWQPPASDLAMVAILVTMAMTSSPLSHPIPSRQIPSSGGVTSCRHANFNSFINSAGKRLAGSVGVEVAGSVN